MDLALLSVILAGGSLAVSLVVLFVVLRVLHNSRRSREGGIERLEILREQQDRLRVMYQERSMLKEELERLRSMMEEEARVFELPAPAELETQPEKERGRFQGRGRFRRFFGF